jgi:hypothetical protein
LRSAAKEAADPPSRSELRRTLAKIRLDRDVDRGALPSRSPAWQMPAIAVRHGTWLDTIGRRLLGVPTELFVALFLALLFLALCGLLGFSDSLAQFQKLEVFSFEPTEQIRACRARPGPIIRAALKRISDHENRRLFSGNGSWLKRARPRGFATMAGGKIRPINLTGFTEIVTMSLVKPDVGAASTGAAQPVSRSVPATAPRGI